MDKRNTVVVTGVSSGIGLAVTQDLLAAGYRVFGSVRKQSDADAAAARFGDSFTPLIFDVTELEAVRRGASTVRAALGEGGVLTALVNNAGAAAGAGPLMHAELSEIRAQFEINVIGLLAVTQAFLPLLGARRPTPKVPGRVINVSSVGGRIAAPFIGAYAASKHAVEGLSDSLRRELMLYGVDVVVIEPGAVQTPIWDKAEQLDVSALEGTDYGALVGRFRDDFVRRGRKGLEPQKIAAAVRNAIETAKPRARYALVPQRFVNWTLPRLLPTRWLDRIIASAVGLKPEAR